MDSLATAPASTAAAAAAAAVALVPKLELKLQSFVTRLGLKALGSGRRLRLENGGIGCQAGQRRVLSALGAEAQAEDFR